MIELSYALRGKPSWWTKIKDPAVRSQWKAEARQYQIRGDKLKDAEIQWVLDELEDYAKMRDEATGIQVGRPRKQACLKSNVVSNVITAGVMSHPHLGIGRPNL